VPLAENLRDARRECVEELARSLGHVAPSVVRGTAMRAAAMRTRGGV
jgi:hypothetical protein